MNLHDLVSQFILDTKGTASGLSFSPDSSLGLFRPELTICATIVVLMLTRIVRLTRWIDAYYVALVGTLVALYFAAPWKLIAAGESFPRHELFTGMLVYDGFTVFLRGFLLVFLVLLLVFTRLSGVPEREDRTDIWCLILGSTLGMCLMASANHLLMVFLAVEMASVPSYVLAGMLKTQRLASEAALKYSVYGAGAAGVMLYGISLIAGLVNTVHLPSVAAALAARLPNMPPEELMVLALGGLMIGVGLAFKLSAVPFHFWCPDVFAGATAEVGAFLSVASKAAALSLLVRVAIGFGFVPPLATTAAPATTAQVTTDAAAGGLYAVADEPASRSAASPDGNASAPEPSPAALLIALSRSRSFMAYVIAAVAIVTCTFGNLAAYGQTNLKRLLAYSTIAHAGYMLMAVPPVLALASVDLESARGAVAALMIYIAVYLFMNLGAFAVVAFLRNAMHSEELRDYAGLVRRCPGVVICFAVMLLSLIGLPPLAGFLGKFAVFAALANGYRLTSQPYLIVLLVAGGLNTAVSLFYYLNVVRVMTMSPEPESRQPMELPLVSLPGMYILAITLPTALLILGWNSLGELALAAARNLLT